MAPNRASKTAEAVAAARAAHFFYDDPIVFRDPFAIQLTSPIWRTIVNNRFLHWLVIVKLLSLLRPIHGWVLARARYNEEQLDKAIAKGIKQYVIIGAGLDSFVLRRPELADKLKVFELDHPASQEIKRQRLLDITGSIPKNLVFVPVDFKKATIADALRVKGRVS